ncbi:MAG: DUF4833 domain-containing protein [Bacteroidales bacterium]|nr:DUF4833 domain-containing protein [Bacteroidales bacterium]
MNFIKKIAGVIIIITSMLPKVGFATGSENHKGNLLFKIERNRDADEIYYELNPDETGRPDKKEPVKIYWVKHTQNGKTEPLTWIQNKYSYGIKTIEPEDAGLSETQKEKVCFRFVSFGDCFFSLKPTSEGIYKAIAHHKNREIEVSGIFVQIEGDRFRMPSVPFVQLHGIDLATGQPVTETIYP